MLALIDCHNPNGGGISSGMVWGEVWREVGHLSGLEIRLKIKICRLLDFA
jgi:hypothetical protein